MFIIYLCPSPTLYKILLFLLSIFVEFVLFSWILFGNLVLVLFSIVKGLGVFNNLFKLGDGDCGNNLFNCKIFSSKFVFSVLILLLILKLLFSFG